MPNLVSRIVGRIAETVKVLRKGSSAPPSTRQQAYVAGHGAGYWNSDHFNELLHFTSWNYVGIHTVAKLWAGAEVEVFDKSWQARLGVKSKALATPDGSAEKLTPLPDHPAAKLLTNPNPYVSGRTFRYQVACQIRLTGGCLIWEVPNQFNEPSHLWVIPRGWARPVMPTPQYPNGGYWVSPAFTTYSGNTTSAAQWFVPFEQMIRVGWPDPVYPGEFTSPLNACRQLIDISEQTDTATAASFLNTIHPSVLISILDGAGGMQPVTQEQIDQVRAQLDAMHVGAQNRGKHVVANNIDVKAFQSGPSDLDYVNGRKQNRENVLGLQNVAPTLAGFTEATNYSGAAVAAKTTVEFSVQPDLDLFADEMTKRFRRYWGDDFKIVVKAKSFDDPTLKLQKADKLLAARQAGVKVSDNQILAALDEPPIEGGDEWQPDLGVMKTTAVFTTDELREKAGYDPLPNGQGATLPGAQVSQPGRGDDPNDPNAAGDLGIGDEGDAPAASADSPLDFDLAPTLGDDDTSGEHNSVMRGRPSMNGAH